MLAFDARHPDYNHDGRPEPVQQVACREYLGDLDRGIEGYLWPADDHRRDQDVKKSAASRNPSVESVRELWVIAGREVGYGLNSQPDRRAHRGLQ